MMKKNLFVILISLAVASFTSCKKFVQEPPPKNQLISSAVFADSVGASAALNGVYINLMQNFGFSFNNGGITNKTLEFNGSEQMSFLAIAEKISEIVKEPIRYISPKVTDFEAKMKEIGLPDHVIEILSTFSLSIAQGEFDQQSIDLEMVLGRKTKSLYEFLKETYN
jgi:hypothetical protein